MKKILIIFLCILMVMGIMPATAFSSTVKSGAEVSVGDKEYASIEEALADPRSYDGSSSPIKLMKDIEISEPLNIYPERDVYIDLNGHSLKTSDEGKILFDIWQETCLTVVNGSSVNSELKGKINMLGNNSAAYIDESLYIKDNISYSRAEDYPVGISFSYTYYYGPETEIDINSIRCVKVESYINEYDAIFWGNEFRNDEGVYLRYIYDMTEIADLCSKVDTDTNFRIVANTVEFVCILPEDLNRLLNNDLDAFWESDLLYFPVEVGDTVVQAMDKEEEHVNKYYSQYQFQSAKDYLNQYEADIDYEFQGWYEYSIDFYDGEKFSFSNEKLDFNSEVPYFISVCGKWKAKNNEAEKAAVERVAGPNRYETAVAVADKLKEAKGIEKFNNVIVAYGDNYADALAGSYLAKVKDAPILVVNTNTVTEKYVRDYINKNVNKNGTVYILGGEGVVTKRFENSLSGYNVKRLGGATRFDTNLSILKEAGVKNEDILVCSAWSFADSLSASAVGKPILLVDSKLNATQKTYLSSLGSENYYLIGGESAVSNTVKAEVSKYGKATRIAGANRYTTSAAIADKFFTAGSSSIVIASGLDFPDGLTGGPLAMENSAPLFLVADRNTGSANEFVKKNDSDLVTVVGGKGAVSEAIVNEIIG